MFTDYYGPQVRFGAPFAAFWFDEDVLDIRIPSADIITFDYMSRSVLRS
jgi:hypothetical protein